MSDTVQFLQDILPHVHAELPGCPEPIIQRECLAVVRDFLDHTKSWQETLDPIGLTAGEAEYILDGWDPKTTEINAVLQVTRDGRLLLPPIDYAVVNYSILKLARIPTAAKRNSLVVVVALRPSATATEVRSCALRAIFDHNIETIAAGTLSRCQGMQKTEWTDSTAAAINYKRYKDGRVDERIRVQKAGTVGTLTMRQRVPFLRVTSRGAYGGIR